jgi:hypothetical protein
MHRPLGALLGHKIKDGRVLNNSQGLSPRPKSFYFHAFLSSQRGLNTWEKGMLKVKVARNRIHLRQGLAGWGGTCAPLVPDSTPHPGTPVTSGGVRTHPRHLTLCVPQDGRFWETVSYDASHQEKGKTGR